MAVASRFSETALQSRLKLNQLSFLAAVAEERSIGKAARRLNISQPAATKLLRDIEQSLGVQLFERSRHGVTATVYGDLMLPTVRRILGEVRHLADGLNALRAGAAGRVVIGTLISAAGSLLPLAIARLNRDWPDITVKIVEGTDDVLAPTLRTGDIDMILGRVSQLSETHDVTVTELYREPFVIIARHGHPLSNGHGLNAERLAEAGWVLPPPQTTTRRELIAAFARAGQAPPRVVAESASILVNLRLVETSDLLSMIPANLAAYFCARAQLVTLPIDLQLTASRVGVTTFAGRALTPAARRMIEAVEAVTQSGEVGQRA